MNLSYQEIVLKPLLTEKSTNGLSFNKYTFKVHEDANKIQIRQAIEKLFKVKVIKVNTVMMRGKSRRRLGRYVTKNPDWKKAVVTVREGDKIKIEGVELFEP